MVCDDNPGIQWIKLREVQFFWGGANNEVEIRKASDVFAAYEARNREMPQAGKINVAKFEVKFHDSKTSRKVTVRAHNTQCVRDADTALIEAWLAARGFSSSGAEATSDTSEATPEILVDAGVVAGLANKLRGMGLAVGVGVQADSTVAATVR